VPTEQGALGPKGRARAVELLLTLLVLSAKDSILNQFNQSGGCSASLRPRRLGSW
jgi:hypothetical protein